jgi:hypothetical protein
MDLDDSLLASLPDADNRRDNEVIMKNLLTIAILATFLYACGGGYTQQEKVSADKALPAKPSTMEVKSEETAEVDQVIAEQTPTDSKSGSAIRMFQGIARSML